MPTDDTPARGRQAQRPTTKAATPPKTGAKKTAAARPQRPAAPTPAPAEELTDDPDIAMMLRLAGAFAERLMPRETPTDLRALLDALAAPFAASEVEWKPGKKAGDKMLAMPYVKARAVQDRLDQCCTWKSEFRPGPDGGVICGISVRVVQPDGRAEWMTRWDGADNTQIEGTKGGLSDSFKRAAVQWGVFRYGYRIPTQFVRVDERGRFIDRPEIPPHYLPQGDGDGLARDSPQRLKAEQGFHATGVEAAGDQAAWNRDRPHVIRLFAEHYGLDIDAFSTHSLTTVQIEALTKIMREKIRRRRPLIELPPAQDAPRVEPDAPDEAEAGTAEVEHDDAPLGITDDEPLGIGETFDAFDPGDPDDGLPF